MKKGAKIALLGENYFPPVNTSHMTKRREKGLNKIMNAVLHYEPSVVYVCPTKGVNINLVPLLLLNSIKLRLVFPSKHFFANLNEDEKYILEMAAGHADKIIILSDKKCDPLNWANEWYKATERVIANSDWVMIVHNQQIANVAFEELLNRFDQNPKPVLAVGIGEEA